MPTVAAHAGRGAPGRARAPQLQPAPATNRLRGVDSFSREGLRSTGKCRVGFEDRQNSVVASARVTDHDRLTVLLTVLSIVVAALSLVIAAVTLALVWVAELRFRRRSAAVFWWLHYVEAKQNTHHYQLMNLGSESATNMTVECTSGLQTDGAPMSVVKSGENYPLEIPSTDFDNDWLLVRWMSVDDRRFVCFQWFPMNENGPLQRTWLDQWDKAVSRRWWSRLFRKNERVGPGAGVYFTKTPAFKLKKSEKQLDIARSLLVATRDQKTHTSP